MFGRGPLTSSFGEFEATDSSNPFSSPSLVEDVLDEAVPVSVKDSFCS